VKKTKSVMIKLVSLSGSGYSYTYRKSGNNPHKLLLRKYDPYIGHHTWFKEERISRAKR